MPTSLAISGVGGRRVFSLLDLAPALWLDGADAGSVYQDSALTTAAVSDGDPVGGWMDRSGNARHATQATAAKQPILKVALQNGRNGVRCDGVDDFLATDGFTNDSPRTLFLVVKIHTGAVGAYLHDGLVSNTCAGRQQPAGGDYCIDVGDTEGGVTLGTTMFAVVCAIYDAGTLRVYKNAEAVVESGGGTPNASGLTLGTYAGADAYFGAIDLGEVLLFSSALSDIDRTQVRTYLNQKWAVY